MNDFEKRVLEDLAELKTDMKWIAGGDGHPGRLQEMAEQVERHEEFLQRARGLSAAFACLLTIVHLGFDYLRMHLGR
jgi:hypothetical protein